MKSCLKYMCCWHSCKTKYNGLVPLPELMSRRVQLMAVPHYWRLRRNQEEAVGQVMHTYNLGSSMENFTGGSSLSFHTVPTSKLRGN